MSSDQDYEAFLKKANEDLNAAGTSRNTVAASSAIEKFKARDEGLEVPAMLKDVTARDFTLASDSDEPFEAVVLKWMDKDGNGLPDERKSCRGGFCSYRGCSATDYTQ